MYLIPIKSIQKITINTIILRMKKTTIISPYNHTLISCLKPNQPYPLESLTISNEHKPQRMTDCHLSPGSRKISVGNSPDITFNWIQRSGFKQIEYIKYFLHLFRFLPHPLVSIPDSGVISAISGCDINISLFGLVYYSKQSFLKFTHHSSVTNNINCCVV